MKTVIFLLNIFATLLLGQGSFSAPLCKNVHRNPSFLGEHQTAIEAILRLRKTSAGRLFDHPEFYQFFKDKPQSLARTISRWYGSEFYGLWAPRFKFENLDASVLLLDPGIVDRAAEFVRFSEYYVSTHSNLNVFELRQAFREYLGSRSFYRVLSLTRDEVNDILQNGMSSVGIHRKTTSPFEWLERSSAGPLEDIQSRLRENDGTRGLTISVSEFREVALAAAFTHFNPHDLERSFYVFKIRIPEINLVRENQRMFSLPKALSTEFKKNPSELVVVSPDGEGYTIPRHEGGLESFIFNHISADEIMSAMKHEDLRPWIVQSIGSTKGNNYLESVSFQEERRFQETDDFSVPEIFLKYRRPKKLDYPQ